PLYLAHTSQRSVSNHRRGPTIALHAIHSVADAFQASPSPRRLAATSRRIEFVILRTASSSPVAPHPASQRRSYLQLRGHGLPRHGLAPCCVHAFRGALGAHSVSERWWHPTGYGHPRHPRSPGGPGSYTCLPKPGGTP